MHPHNNYFIPRRIQNFLRYGQYNFSFLGKFLQSRCSAVKCSEVISIKSENSIIRKIIMEKSAIFRIVQKKRQILFEILNATMEHIPNKNQPQWEENHYGCCVYPFVLLMVKSIANLHKMVYDYIIEDLNTICILCRCIQEHFFHG